MTRPDLIAKVRLLKRLGLAALLGLAAIAYAASLDTPDLRGRMLQLVFLGAILIIPGLFYAIALCIWHWKARYQGARSNLWGVLLVVETSGWFKIVYLFRHVLPDARGTGRYSAAADGGGA